MSFVSVVQGGVAEAARALAGVGSELSEASAAVAAPTTGVAAAAEDEVSIAVAGLFGDFGQEFQAFSAQVQEFHGQFVAKLTQGLGQYASAEAANVQQTLAGAVNAPAEALLGQPLIGTGASAAASVVPSVPFSATVLNYATPLGAISLTVNGEASLLGTVTVTGGNLQVPTPLALAFDALGPEANVLFALQNGGAAFANAVQTGNPIAAAEALLQTPGNAVRDFFVGQQSFTESTPLPSGTQYTSASLTVPVDGLLAPLQPVTLTLFSSDGTVTPIPLGGTEFGGLVPAILGL